MLNAARLSLLLLAFTNANANVILRTGVDGSLSTLAAGASDPAWTISVNGGSTFTAAKVLFPAQICCGMETVASTAAWISDPSVVAGNSATAWGIGNTVFARRTFNLTSGEAAVATISGLWRVADNRLGIFLNNTLLNAATANGANAWSADQAFSGGAGLFVSGANTLELRGNSINSQFDGFWLDATVNTGVPEPGSLVLMGGGLTALVLFARRRRA